MREESDGEQFPGTAPTCEAGVRGDEAGEMQGGLEELVDVCQLEQE